MASRCQREEAVQKGLIRPDQESEKQSVFITGTDAFKLFVDEAHKRGMNVLSGRGLQPHLGTSRRRQSSLASSTGTRARSSSGGAQYRSQTPWGDKPAFSAPGVKEFFTNNAAQQLQEFHCDGMRFDFVQVLHDTGSTDEKREGMNTLRQINRTVQFLKPGTYNRRRGLHPQLAGGGSLRPGPSGRARARGAWRRRAWASAECGTTASTHDLLGLISNSKARV